MRREWPLPVLCLVTDRRRLTTQLGAPDRDSEELLAKQMRGAIRGGVDVIQIRERDLDSRALLRVVRAAVAAAAGTAVSVLVNDRVDIAIAAASSGVHLREDSVANGVARRLLGQRLVGRSVHRASAVDAVLDADYLIAGSAFETSSKPGATSRLGLDGLQEVVERAGGCPVWAIGGVMPERASQIAAAGAVGVAAISMFIPQPGTASLEIRVQELTARLRFSFDRAWARS
jgi:thiamine-phosphate pyrophosphorylase